MTYAQYEPFVEAGGYEERRYWTKAGWAWKQKTGVTEPRYWNDAKWHRAKYPVIGVSWYEAYAYAQWLAALTGPHLLPLSLRERGMKARGGEGEYVIRLLRECEWEKAARYPDGRLWPWGNDWDEGRRVNWYGTGLGRTSKVGAFPDGANPAHGAQDMIGNVWEWCLTKWRGEYHSPGAEDNDPEGKAMRCARGGSWSGRDQGNLRAAARGWIAPDYGVYDQGFRLCVSVPV